MRPSRKQTGSNPAQAFKSCHSEEDFPPALLGLELTESVAVERAEIRIPILESFPELGIRVSIDDFGTGHSSLSHLRRLPTHTLKIDRSFVMDTPENGDAVATVAAAIAMAKTLKLTITAAGIETKEQLEFPQSLGCDEFQGYYLAHPMPAADCLEWIEQHLRPLCHKPFDAYAGEAATAYRDCRYIKNKIKSRLATFNTTPIQNAVA